MQGGAYNVGNLIRPVDRSQNWSTVSESTGGGTLEAPIPAAVPPLPPDPFAPCTAVPPGPAPVACAPRPPPIVDVVPSAPDVRAELLVACFPGRNATINTIAITARMNG